MQPHISCSHDLSLYKKNSFLDSAARYDDPPFCWLKPFQFPFWRVKPPFPPDQNSGCVLIRVWFRKSPRNPPLTSLHACFCYASPLERGLRELNVRAEWEVGRVVSWRRSSRWGVVATGDCFSVLKQQGVELSKPPHFFHWWSTLYLYCFDFLNSIKIQSMDGSPQLI